MEKQLKYRKSIAVILILSLIFTLPAGLFNNNIVDAATVSSTPGQVDIETDLSEGEVLHIYNSNDGNTVIASAGGIQIAEAAASAGIKVTGTSNSSANKSIIISGSGKGEVNVIFSNLNITTSSESENAKSPVSLSSGAEVNLKLEKTNNLESTSQNYSALNVSTPNAITISGINGGTGTLNALCNYKNDSNAAAIGGNSDYVLSTKNSCGPINITTGASISAICMNGYGAGIGGGDNGAGSNISILGGSVYAESECGAAIGGGQSGAGSNITISGGNVQATMQKTEYAGGAAIGGGRYGAGTNIHILGGHVIADASKGRGAGIGGGEDGMGSYINISAGTVIAKANYGAGIGGGKSDSMDDYAGKASNITISGGNITAESRGGAGIGGGVEAGATDITISGGIVRAKADGNANEIITYPVEPGSGIGGGGLATSSGIRITGGFVTAESSFIYDTTPYSGDGIGSGGFRPGGSIAESTDIFITGGSVVAKSDGNDVGMQSTPTAIDGNDAYEVNIPLEDPITYNKDIVVSVGGLQYTAKTVSGTGEQCEHGSYDIDNAATIYLPVGTHEMYIDNEKCADIIVNSDGSSVVDTGTYIAKIDKTSITLPSKIFNNHDYTFSAKGDGRPLEKQDDTRLVPTSWAITKSGTQITSGSITDGKGTFSLTGAGEYKMTVTFEESIYNGQNWTPTNSGIKSKTVDFTVEATPNNVGLVDIERDISNGDQLIIYYDQSKNEVVASAGGIKKATGKDGIMITGESKSGKSVAIRGGNNPINIILNTLSISHDSASLIALDNNANVNLMLKGNNTFFNSSVSHSALHVSEPNTINISGYNSAEGNLSITNRSEYTAAIGGIENESSGSIKINNGANISIYSAGTGIGGGANGNGKDITISGGKVHVVNVGHGAAIGGGEYGKGSNINISGGIITAESIWDHGGAAIGGGNRGIGDNINISGGIVYASVPNDYSYGAAAIGGGGYATGSAITISGGTVYATNGGYGAGIGGGGSATGHNIAITGGFVNAQSVDGSDIGGGRESTSSNIKIIGGSVVCKSEEKPFDSDPINGNSAKVYKANIPVSSDIPLGNKDITVTVGTTSYKAKTVKAHGTNCEHGSAYNYAATAYLPLGTHNIAINGKAYGTIKVNGEDNIQITKASTPNQPTQPDQSQTLTTSIVTSQKTIYLKKGQSITLPLVENTNDGKKTKLTYKSSKPKIATVTQSGKVKAKKKGKTVITVKSINGKSLKFTINVANKATKVKKISVKYSKTMKVGASKGLKVTISPKKATKAVATFKSSNSKVLSVDKAGKLKAKKKGTAKITVKAGGKKKVVKIKVK